MPGVRGLGVVVAREQLAQQERRLRGSWRCEDDFAAPALVGDDEVLVGLQVPPAPAGVLEQQPMKVQQERHGRPLVAVDSYERVDRVAVPGELLLVSIAKPRRAFCDLQGAFAADNHALDRVGGRDRGDARVFREALQQLRELIREELLASPGGVDARQDGAKLTRLIGERAVEVDEAFHRDKDRIIVIKNAGT